MGVRLRSHTDVPRARRDDLRKGARLGYFRGVNFRKKEE